MDLYKYYTKEQYEEYGNILETAKEIDERLNRNKIDNYNNTKLVNANKKNWKDRTYETYQYKGFWYYPPNDPEFIDD
jgi:hypothetical protein